MENQPFTDKRDINEIVMATKAEDKYNHIVNEFIRDRNSGWKLDYFKDDGKNSNDLIIFQMRDECNVINLRISANNALMKKLDSDIAKSRLSVQDPEYKKAKKGDVILWDKQHVQAQEDNYHDSKLLEQIKEQISQYEWNRYLEDKMRRTLRWLRGRFMMDKDKEFLAKGVTWAITYNLKMRHNIFEKYDDWDECTCNAEEDLTAW
jgi:hypothetical protein